MIRPPPRSTRTEPFFPHPTLFRSTTGQLISLGILIVGDYGPDGFHIRLLGEIGIWVAAVLTLYTGWDYLQSGLRYMAGNPTTAAKPQDASDQELPATGAA